MKNKIEDLIIEFKVDDGLIYCQLKKGHRILQGWRRYMQDPPILYNNYLLKEERDKKLTDILK